MPRLREFFPMRPVMGGLCLVLLALTACTRDPEKRQVLKTDHVRAWLRGATLDSTIKLASGDTVHVSKATLDFYKRRRWRPAWVGPGDLLGRGTALMKTIAKSDEDGLSSNRYRYDAAYELLRRMLSPVAGQEISDSLKAPYLASLDVLLTEGFNRYANDLVTGTLDPKEAGLQWRIPRGSASEERILQSVITGTPPAQVVAHLRPSIPYYDRMREALADYRKASTRGPWPQVTGGLKPGARSNSVNNLRTRFIAGIDPTEASLAQKGAGDPLLFDADLKKALEHFQDRHGIESDGALGEQTVKELNHTIEERIDELKLNLDRWRWLPDNLGERYLIVNVAGFELEVVDKGRVIETMAVVVGKPSWSTTLFADTMENLVVNPYWNVPKNIYDDEIAVALAQDPGYLERNNMERTKDGGVRQRPGPKNALGQFKFIFPNQDDIYLHDTPADHLFSRARRDFSHGCIRLERPRDLANLVMKLQTNKDPAVLDEMLASGSERWIKLDQKLPIYILYFTAWVKEDGTVSFHHDIYGRDEKLKPQQGKLDGIRASL